VCGKAAEFTSHDVKLQKAEGGKLSEKTQFAAINWSDGDGAETACPITGEPDWEFPPKTQDSSVAPWSLANIMAPFAGTLFSKKLQYVTDDRPLVTVSSI
jgi:hypothetical protein